MIYERPDYIFDATSCGQNCAKRLVEIGKRIIPADFYKTLTSKYRRIYADCILLIFNNLKPEISYEVNRELLKDKEKIPVTEIAVESRRANSLAFKPMNNVKDFINKFVLNEGRVDVESLRNNIKLLDDLEKTLDKAKRQLSSLEDILKVFDDIDAKDREMIISEGHFLKNLCG